MESIILFLCILFIFFFASFISEQTTLNVDNIRIIKPPSVFTAPELEVFKYYVKISNQTQEQAWNSIIELSENYQTLEDFLETKKIDYRLKGIMISLLTEIAYKKHNKKYKLN